MEFKVKDKVMLLDNHGKDVFTGVIVNINDFRPPEARYCVYVEGESDYIFIGENAMFLIKKLEEI